MAMEKIEKDGLELNGRPLRVQWAERKSQVCLATHLDVSIMTPFQHAGDAERNKEKQLPKMPFTSKPSTIKRDKDPDAIRTIVISGLPSSADKKALWKKLRKLKGAESVELAGDGPGVGACPCCVAYLVASILILCAAYALFATPPDASNAVEKLHAHVFKGAILSVTLKKRIEALAKASAKATNGSAAPNRASRLIVRNVPWSVR